MTDARCPCCGGAIDRDAIKVDLNTNTVAVGWSDKSAKVKPAIAELLAILAKAMPGVARHDAIILGIWGIAEGDCASNNVKVLASQARAKLAPLGLTIISVWGTGYRLVRTEEGARHAA